MIEMIQLLLGSLCILCHQRLHGRHARLQLCEYCLADLPWDTEVAQPEPPSSIAHQITPLFYQGAAAAWVLKAKHHSGLVEARVLGTLLAETLCHHYPDPRQRPEIIVPVPLSLRRLLARGHNQAALIAQPASRTLAIPIDRRIAVRVRHTPIQPGLDPTHRARNVAHAFRCRKRLTGQVVAIVDDVVTSGATVTALADCLIEAGASAIHVWCPTRAPGAATLPTSTASEDNLGDNRNPL
jgi:ComF family protein